MAASQSPELASTAGLGFAVKPTHIDRGPAVFPGKSAGAKWTSDPDARRARIDDLLDGLDKKLVKLARWLGTKVLRLDSFNF
jgi:hypothetical protein